jgi:alpha-galactosidase
MVICGTLLTGSSFRRKNNHPLASHHATGVAVLDQLVRSRTTVPVHLRAGGTSVVVDARGDGLPRLVHWGADLGDVPDEVLTALADAQVPQRVSGGPDAPVPFGVLPEHAAGWQGTPGLVGHRDGADFSTHLLVHDVEVTGQGLVAHASDARAGIDAAVEVEVTGSGLVRVRASVRNTGDSPFDLGGVLPALPVPDTATELLDTTGRHLRERSPQRLPFVVGTHLRESRRGRPGADATLVLAAGEPGFGARSGRVWGIHVAWSGNHRVLAERAISGEAFLAGGELLLPGEVRLGPGDGYESPWLYGSHGDGLDELAGRFHDHLRGRPHHPRTPRPVTLNTWEAVYFDHDLGRLTELADLASDLGVERFVLDDGWFGSRRDDSRGLGDWHVSSEVWPDGLHPLADHVVALGMEFGLWVEPEMINPDSDLARAHPDWILGLPGRVPPPARQQQVLDLANPAAFAHILGRLDALLDEYPIAYLKWDHNRDLVDAGHGALGVAGVRGQTLAVYRLLDELRARHPGLEIESCASGGARVDLEILERTDRVWASDCIDPLEREQIQRWTGLLLPPELIGEHVGGPVSHTTGRQHVLDFRAASAFFGHLGVEWDVSRATADERARLAEWIAAHKALRGLLHTGRRVHADHPDPAVRVHGVVAVDGAAAVYAVTQVATSLTYPTGWLRLPGLDPDAVYDVRPLPPGDRIEGTGQSPLPWWADGARLTGRVLTEVGVRAPVLYPERTVLVRAERTDALLPAHTSH